MQSPLEHESRLLAEIISISKGIIEKQNWIKNTAERLKDENENMKEKRDELQQILMKSQKELQSWTTIPIGMMNKLAEEIKHMKTEQEKKTDALLLSVCQSHQKFGLARQTVESHVNNHHGTSVGAAHGRTVAVSKLVKEILLCPIV